MKVIFTIHEIAQILNIAPSTLRYWDEQGLHSINKNKNNGYREYTMTDLITLADILFYRKLGVQMKHLKNYDTLDFVETENILNQLEINVSDSIKKYLAILDKIHNKQFNITEIKRMYELDYTYEDIPFDKVAKFEYTEKDKVSAYIDNISRYIKYQNSRDLSSEIRGIIVDENYNTSDILWVNNHSSKFASFLVEEIVSENYKNNIHEKIKLINTKHRTGIILAQFLLTANIGNKRIDFLKAYVELLD